MTSSDDPLAIYRYAVYGDEKLLRRQRNVSKTTNISSYDRDCNDAFAVCPSANIESLNKSGGS